MAAPRLFRLIQRIEGLPIILVFVVLLALFMYMAPQVFLRLTSTRPSSRPCRR